MELISSLRKKICLDDIHAYRHTHGRTDNLHEANFWRDRALYRKAYCSITEVDHIYVSNSIKEIGVHTNLQWQQNFLSGIIIAASEHE